MLNMGMLLGCVGGMGYYMYDPSFSTGMQMLGLCTGLSGALGVTLTSAIGGKL